MRPVSVKELAELLNRAVAENKGEMLGAYVYFYSLNPHGKYVKDILKEMR